MIRTIIYLFYLELNSPSMANLGTSILYEIATLTEDEIYKSFQNLESIDN